MEKSEAREKLFRNYANTHHEEYSEVIKQLKANMNGAPAPNYQKVYEMVFDLEPDDVFIVIGCSFHTGISVDLRAVARNRRAQIVEIQEDAAHNVRKVLKELLK